MVKSLKKEDPNPQLLIQNKSTLQQMSSVASESISNPNVLVTGGAGYIGSHTVLQLLLNGYDVTIVDNLCNSSEVSTERVIKLAKCDKSRVTFHNVDICDRDGMEAVFKAAAAPFSACIHFAGLKAVGESVKLPLKYYHNNLTGTFYLVELMQQYGCKKIVFSSSATVYGTAASPLTESSQVGVGVTNPYGRTKYFLEEILRDTTVSDPTFGVILLRYFNPVGAHESGMIGEDPQGIPNNLMPYVQQVAVGRREKLTVHGDDYDTPDGTGVRDYIHVVDLASGHLAALRKLDTVSTGCNVYNLGTGNGYSVLDMVKAMRKASGAEIPYVVGPRREGDLGSCYANPAKARDELGWQAELGIERMCADAWRWQSENPTGYNPAK